MVQLLLDGTIKEKFGSDRFSTTCSECGKNDHLHPVWLYCSLDSSYNTHFRPYAPFYHCDSCGLTSGLPTAYRDIVNKNNECPVHSTSKPCTNCGGDGLIDGPQNCEHGKSSRHNYCSHGKTVQHD